MQCCSLRDYPEWFSGFEVGIAPKHPYAAMSPEERKLYNKAQHTLMVFPDISMWGNHGGMLVKKDYWKELQAELNDYDTKLMMGRKSWFPADVSNDISEPALRSNL